MICQRGGTWFRLTLPVLVVALGGITLLRAQEPAAKKPIPDAGSLQQVLTLVEEVYGGEFKQAKDVAQRTALAEKLLQKAKESAADPTGQYALLKVAKDIAALAGDADLALRAVDDMATTFQIETFPAKVETLLKTAQSASQTKQHAIIITHAAALIELAVKQDDFDTARTLSQAARATARKNGDSALVKKAVARDKEVEATASAYAGVKDALAKLRTDPVDPEPNLAVGTYRCLVKGEWERGISYLALGSDPRLKELATRELQGVSDANGQVALGDGWWDLASASEESAQRQLQARAAYWYRKALPGLTGLVKDKVSKRLEVSALDRETSATPASSEAGKKQASESIRKTQDSTKTYTFTDENTLKQNWELSGPWRVEAEGLRIYGGAGNVEPGKRGGVSLLKSSSVFTGDFALEMAYKMSDRCEIWLHLWNQQFEFTATGNAVARLVRKGDTVMLTSGNQAPKTIKLKAENLESATPIALHLDRRKKNWLNRRHEALFWRVGVLSVPKTIAAESTSPMQVY